MISPEWLWECVSTSAGEVTSPAELVVNKQDWTPAFVPGTAALALGRLGTELNFDSDDWWFRARFSEPGDGPWDLVFDGVATVADYWLNGVALGHSENMFRSYRFAIEEPLVGSNELLIRCAALSPLLKSRRRPRPAWKARLPADQSLRWFRTTLLGRSPAWTPDIAPVGPWRPVSLQPRAAIEAERQLLKTSYDSAGAALEVRFSLTDARAENALTGPFLHAHSESTDISVVLVVGEDRRSLEVAVGSDGEGALASGSFVYPWAEAWWPSTHGEQRRYPAHLEVSFDGNTEFHDLGQVGFRSISFEQADHPELTVNGVPVFCRGACWVPLDPIGLTAEPVKLRATLEQVRDSGMNILRVQGSLVYESPAFHELCDELGILVWQDLMFATLDYPISDPEFAEEVEAELVELLTRLQLHPSTAVICGGSEVHQQAAMVGQLQPGEVDELFDHFLPALVEQRLPGASYWPNSPTWTGRSTGAAFSVDTGIAHYFGVGGYLRPLSDARTSGVRFASECLAFSNIPGDQTMNELNRAGLTVGSPGWKQGVPRDAGRAWDFEEVRDHYVAELFGVDPVQIRATEPDHYLDLGRAAVAEVMATTFAEWRRGDSPCSGALVLTLRDLVDGAGFGLIDARSRPKSALFALRRVLAPIGLFICDEGLNGLDVHLANDKATPIEGSLRITAHQGVNRVAEGEVRGTIDPCSSKPWRVETVLGGFYDIGWAYRFGPQSIDCVAATWEPLDGPSIHAVHLPGGQPLVRREIGLGATFALAADGQTELSISTELAAHCVLINTVGQPSDDAFNLEPGRTKMVMVRNAGDKPITLRSINGGSTSAVPATQGC